MNDGYRLVSQVPGSQYMLKVQVIILPYDKKPTVEKSRTITLDEIGLNVSIVKGLNCP